MPFYIRHLPGRVSSIIDRKGQAADCVFYNPSRAGPFTSIRATHHNGTQEKNVMLLHNDDTKEVYTLDTDLLEPSVNYYTGLEDVRIVDYGGCLWFTATSTHASQHMTNELIVGCLDATAKRIARCAVIDIGSRPVKNVVPFVLDGCLLLLDVSKSKIHHIVDAVIDGRTTCVIDRSRDIEWAVGAPDTYRGSTSPIHLHGNTWGCVVHDVIWNDSVGPCNSLSYLHHWLEIDVVRGVVTFVSSPFWVAHWGIEFVSGIERRPDGAIRIYLGVKDQDAMICETTLYDLRVGK